MMIPPPLGTRAVGDTGLAPVSLLRSRHTGRLDRGGTTDLRRRLCQHHPPTSLTKPATGGRLLAVGQQTLAVRAAQQTLSKEWWGKADRHRAEAMARAPSLKQPPHVFNQLKRRLGHTLAMASARSQEVGG